MAAAQEVGSTLTSEPSLTPAEQKESSNLSIQLGINVLNFDYAEDLTLPKKSTEHGIIPAANFQIKRYFDNRAWFVRLEGQNSAPRLTYDGASMDGQPATFPSKHKFLNIEAGFGIEIYRWHTTNRLLATGGFGYHRWHRGGKNEESAIDYSEDYSWFYFLAGLRFEKELNRSLSLGIEAGVIMPIAGKIKVNMSELNPELNDVTGDLGDKPGIRISATLNYKINNTFFVSATPWAQYSMIGESDIFPLTNRSGATVVHLQEPDSRTFEIGSILALGASL